MAVPSLATRLPPLILSSQLRPHRLGSPLVLQALVMEPQLGSPASPSSPGTPSSGSAKAITPLAEMPTSASSPGSTSPSSSARATATFGEMSMSPSSPGTPSSGASVNVTTTPFVETPPADEPKEEALALERDRQSTSSSSSSSSSSSAGSLFHIDAAGKSLVAALPEDNEQAAPTQNALVKPDEWATWPEETPQTVDNPFSSDSGTAFLGLTEAPLVQTMMEIDAPTTLAGGSGFDPDRIPASVFQPRTSVSQAEWSVASNESLFSIHGARQSTDLGGLYAGSRSHFDYFYDEAMAAAGAEQDSKLPPVAEGTETGDGKEFTMPGSAGSEASDGSDGAKKAAVFRRHERGSGGSSSNFSFAFPILAETSPKKKDCVTAALYQPLEKEYEPPMPQPLAPPASTFVEMTTEEERRRSPDWCCCGCCWFDCSACSTFCCWCCPWPWWQCGCCRCSCSRPSLCQCNWCLCF